MPKIDCRYCDKELVYKSTRDLPFFPFCSERCKLIDLGKWVEEEHRIEESFTPEESNETDESKGE
ncbi:MAG TPA: DNA gyrase inhibitor YacG [Candidatus Avalokitesvara rifleensis]|uniref:DNA gyrase inhibitor YacG n=1 Tax=Candidatus Avalokitesvara rifleensis TaxID=3367620 RepID=UPI002713C5A2|nr:DNA gyrase inhibitor YacG [Candidatus Brocadiales bacterium]